MWKRMWIVRIILSSLVLSGSGISSSQYHKYIILTIKYRNMQPVMDFPTHYLSTSSFYTFRSCGFLSWLVMILNTLKIINEHRTINFSFFFFIKWFLIRTLPLAIWPAYIPYIGWLQAMWWDEKFKQKKNIRKNASFLIRNCQFRLRFDWPQQNYKLIKHYIDRLDTVTRILKEKRPRNFEYYIDHVRLNWCDVFFLSFMPNVGIQINSWKLNKAIIVIFVFNDYCFVIY